MLCVAYYLVSTNFDSSTADFDFDSSIIFRTPAEFKLHYELVIRPNFTHKVANFRDTTPPGCSQYSARGSKKFLRFSLTSTRSTAEVSV